MIEFIFRAKDAFTLHYWTITLSHYQTIPTLDSNITITTMRSMNESNETFLHPDFNWFAKIRQQPTEIHACMHHWGQKCHSDDTISTYPYPYPRHHGGQNIPRYLQHSWVMEMVMQWFWQGSHLIRGWCTYSRQMMIILVILMDFMTQGMVHIWWFDGWAELTNGFLKHCNTGVMMMHIVMPWWW